VQRKGWHTNRSRVVRDSVSELWGSKEKGKKKKKCVKLTEKLPRTHSKQKGKLNVEIRKPGERYIQ